MCVRSGRVIIGGTSVALFTSLLGGQNETYYIAPGDTLELSAIRRSYWHAAGVAFLEYPTSFNLVGRTLFELRYRNRLPEASREILRDFYGWSQPRHRVQMNYLSFLVQRSQAWVAFQTGNSAVSVDMQTRLCHTAQNASLGDSCTRVVGNENCSDILGRLQINHNNPAHEQSWYDPSRFDYHRSWRAGAVTLDFDWGDGRGTAQIRTPPSGASVECNRIQLTENGIHGRLRASSTSYKGLILMRRRAFPDGTRSLDPLGIPELGENELVFRETPSGVQLKTALSAWMLADPPESFLLRIPLGGGGELVLADQVGWFASRLFWRTPNVPFQFSWNRYGYAPSFTQRTVEAEGETVSLGKIFIWNFAEYNAQRLPDYNPAINTNVFGKQVAEMLFRPASNAPLTVVGRANYEVFFPVLGTRCPQVAPREPAGLTVPNWFHYYWRAMGSPNNVVFTNHGPENAQGFYVTGQPHVYILDRVANYVSDSIPLFALRQGECPSGVPQQQVVSRVDTLTIYGIHAFAHTVYHEFGHKWSYETTWQFAPGAYDRIFFPAVGPDGDRDGLLDAWESSHGLCPYRRHTTDAYTHIGDENGGIPGDPEVVADVIAYGQLLNAEIQRDPRTGQATWRSDGLRRHDWSNLGLQFGDLTKRFAAYPWKYSSSGRNISNHSDLIVEWNPIR
jgi:hypothetical protein